jgi:cell division protein FtsB
VKRFLLVPALVAVALVYAIVDEDSGVGTWLAMRDELAAAEERVAEIRREIGSLERDAAELESDAFAIESAIRADLKLARSGELVVRLSPTSVTNTRFP